jgi:phosphoserine phosphatase
MNKKFDTLSLFDFDKTLIKKDSFRVFSLLASNNAWEKLAVYFLALCHKLKIISNSFYKVIVLRIIWFNKKKREKRIFLEEFYKTLEKIENQKVFNALKRHLEVGDKVVVISASPFFYLEPYMKMLSDNIEVFGSKVHLKEGKSELFNLYGEKKLFCAKEIIKKMRPNVVWIYTDHISDLPLIKLADKVRLIKPSAKLIKKLNRLKIDYEIY